MRDYVQEFKKQKYRKNAVIIVASFAFAFMVNGFLFGTNVWNKLQADIKWTNVEKTDKVVKSDIYLQAQWTWSDSVGLKLWTGIKQISELRLNITTNPDENVFKINNIANDVDKNVEIIKVSNIPWVYFLTFIFKKPVDLPADYVFANIFYTKKSGDKIPLSLSDVKFLSNKETFDLTSNSIEL